MTIVMVSECVLEAHQVVLIWLVAFRDLVLSEDISHFLISVVTLARLEDLS